VKQELPAKETIRRFPLLQVTEEQLSSLLSPLLGVHYIERVEKVEGGLTNTILRVWPTGGSDGLLVRVFAGGRAGWEKERSILSAVRDFLPVPEVLLASDGAGDLGYPSLVCRWVEGIPLNAWRKQTLPADVLRLAEPLGRLTATIATPPVRPGAGTETAWRATVSSVGELLLVTQQRLASRRVQRRLGDALADALSARLSKEAKPLENLAGTCCLVHGDLGGRNILVAPDRNGSWHISGLLDWEEAFFGWAAWDVGSLFRYPRRFGEAFRARFEGGYRGAGGALSENWWTTSRLLDATRQIATLDDESERPVVYADCRELLELLVLDAS
jgi:Ser/Thr protein kinase RdoA (MazF antagonist)